MDVSQIRLLVADLPRAYRFYRDVVGLTPQHETEHGPYVAFKPDKGSAIALHDRADFAAKVADFAPGSGDRALVALHVEDLAGYRADLLAMGAMVTDPVRHDGWPLVCHLRDPEGNLLEIQQW